MMVYKHFLRACLLNKDKKYGHILVRAQMNDPNLINIGLNLIFILTIFESYLKPD